MTHVSNSHSKSVLDTDYIYQGTSFLFIFYIPFYRSYY